MLVMAVIVPVRVDRNRVRHMRSEQGDEFRVACDRSWMAGAAHMPVEAYHGVRGGHDHVQIVRDEQHSAAVAECRSCETSSTPQP